MPATPVHAVRDFIQVMIGRWPWPTFNLADSLLVCGAGLLVVARLSQGEGRRSDTCRDVERDPR